ncbi:hypothetical protein B0H14DRAFT_3154817 [Mycena olivaceomarginata]|nr:hypothetical protein B0H14DRAFT_3154817 [Mycena olivaceomarginata]
MFEGSLGGIASPCEAGGGKPERTAKADCVESGGSRDPANEVASQAGAQECDGVDAAAVNSELTLSCSALRCKQHCFSLTHISSLTSRLQDTLWSAQEDRQLIGRIWRQPQPKTVLVYRLIAKNTPDVFLNNISFDKLAMHEAFARATPSMRRGQHSQRATFPK